jgi:hypothetical protein
MVIKDQLGNVHSPSLAPHIGSATLPAGNRP